MKSIPSEDPWQNLVLAVAAKTGWRQKSWEAYGWTAELLEEADGVWGKV